MLQKAASISVPDFRKVAAWMAKATPCEIRLSPPVTSLCGDSSSHNKLSASVKHGTTYFRRISCAEQAAVGVRPHCTHCSETIFNSNVPELAVFFQNIIFHIYMGYFIAFLKYFTEGRVKKRPFFDFWPIFTRPHWDKRSYGPDVALEGPKWP